MKPARFIPRRIALAAAVVLLMPLCGRPDSASAQLAPDYARLPRLKL